MKKLFAGILCATTMMTAVVPALAVEAPKVVSPIVLVTQQSFKVQYTLKINDKNVNLGTQNIVKIKDKIMVPLRITSEALGFTVIWDAQKQTIHMDDGNMETDLTLGEDNYFAYSSKSIGMTEPESLGVAPTTIEGSIYVPVDFYKILLTDSDSVNIKDDVINISYILEKSDKASDLIGMPSPLVNYTTLDEARKAIGFKFTVPTTIPDNYKMGDIIVIGNELAEILYRYDDKEILYRTAKGNADISGDYNDYDKVKTIIIGNTEATVKGKNDSINLATWIKDGVSFSLSFDEAVNEKVLSKIIGSIE